MREWTAADERVAEITARKLREIVDAVHGSKDGTALILRDRVDTAAAINERAAARERQSVAHARRRVGAACVSILAESLVLAATPFVNAIIEADPDSLGAAVTSLVCVVALFSVPITLWRSRKCWRIALTGRDFHPEIEWEHGEIQSTPAHAALYDDRIEAVSGGSVHTVRLDPTYQVRRVSGRVVVSNRTGGVVRWFVDPMVVDEHGADLELDAAEEIHRRLKRL